MQGFPIVCLGLSHHTAPVEVRERHAFPPSRVAETLAALRDYEAVREAAILSTCGRLEIYAELREYEAGVEQLKAFLRAFRHGTLDYDISPYLYTLLGAEAVEHLFQVATGLDSMLIGEPEILGQVKDAYMQAQKAQALGKTLHVLFREALNAGKAARSRTSIADECVGIAGAAVAYAKQRLGDLSQLCVLVIGAGTMGSLAAKRMKLAGAGRILVANRSFQGASSVVESLEMREARALEMSELPEALHQVDIVLAATGSPHFILTPQNVGAAMQERASRGLCIVDIAVPRDTDPEVARIPNVTIVDVDMLGDFVKRNIERRRNAVPAVEEIVTAHVERFAQWRVSCAATPLVAALMRKAETIRENEIERLFLRCPDLSERERALITGASLTIVSKLLHGVIIKLREQAASECTEALSLTRLLEKLFDLRRELVGQSGENPGRDVSSAV